MSRYKDLYRKLPAEALIWAGGLVALFFIDPAHDHFSLCPFHQLGITFCPGCGLGRSVSHLLHGEFVRSFTVHPLGALAVVLLLHRIFQLIKNNNISYGKNL